MNLLIIQLSGLSEVIISTSVFKKIKELNDNTHLTVIVEKQNHEVLSRQKNIDCLLSWDSSQAYRSARNIKEQLKNKVFNEIINLNTDFYSGYLLKKLHAKNKTGFVQSRFSHRLTNKVPLDISRHKHLNSNYLKLLNLSNNNLLPDIQTARYDEQFVKRYQHKNYVCITPGTVTFTSQLPEDKWKHIINTISTETAVYLLGEQRDWDFCELLLCLCSTNNIYNLAGKLSFHENVCLIRKADYLFSNDSYFAQIATATQTICHMVYCATTPDNGMYPLVKGSSIIETTEQLACRPCSLREGQKCPKKHFKCARSIQYNPINQYA